MERTGGCACGAIRFRITQTLLGVGACHCRDCQKASGGGPNYIVLAPLEGFEVTSGEAATYMTVADSGANSPRSFCSVCGTPLWSFPQNLPFVTVKLGALDDASDLVPAMHVYVASAPAWHAIGDNVPTFPKMPPGL